MSQIVEVDEQYDLRDLSRSLLWLLEEVYGQSPWSENQLFFDLFQQQTRYWLYRSGSEILGFLAVSETVCDGEVTQLAVRSSHQGHGIATALLSSLPPDKEWFLEVRESNVPARACYEKNGFQSVGKRKNYYHCPVEDAIVMRRRNGSIYFGF